MTAPSATDASSRDADLANREADVIVVGMGPGGESVGGQLAEAGLVVVGIEAALVGGECPYWGCVPSKMMIRAANLLEESRRVSSLAGASTTMPDWAPVAARIREQATDDWDDTVAVDRFVNKGGHFIRGRATITAPGQVEVNGETWHARTGIVVATGTRAAVPPIPGLADTPFWTNHEIMQVKELPESLIVLGGGPIGSELAQVMSRFGVQVTLVEGAERLLPRNEPEAGDVVAEAFAAEAIEVHTGVFASSVSYQDERFTVGLANGIELQADALLVAVGRQTALRSLGVENLGIDPESRFLATTERQRVQPGVWAVGDIAGDGQFTHLALRQADVVVADILGNDPVELNLDALSAVTFTDPEVGAVGLTEAEARDRGIDVAVAVQRVDHTARGWLHAVGNHGVIKLVADRERGVLVGATSVGPHGGEVLGLLSLAVHDATPISTLRSMIYAYPTFHKGIEDALRQFE